MLVAYFINNLLLAYKLFIVPDTLCSDPMTCDKEFLLSKREYQYQTDRRFIGGLRADTNDVIAYQLRQSFKPGEVTAEEANRIGYETAMRFTKETLINSTFLL